MLKHIVMIKFKAGQDIEKLSGEVSQMLNGLTTTVESLRQMEVGTNITRRKGAFHLVLTAHFDDEAGLNAYRTHPDHVKILERMNETVEELAAVDYFAD